MARDHRLRARRHGDREAARLYPAGADGRFASGDHRGSVSGAVGFCRARNRAGRIAAAYAAQRTDLGGRSAYAYDTDFAGWGSMHKFIDADSMDLLLAAAEKGDAEAANNARATLDAAFNLMDREWGGIYQYSDELDWKSPHYEKIMWFQANGLRNYAQAYALWKEPRYLAAARDLERYLLKLQSAEGGFYTSQDADVDAALPGKSFYALSVDARAKLGREPRIDTNIYARENGWAISGLVAFYNATGDRAALTAAERAASYILANRAIEGGGFAHGARDRAGPYLGDTLAMGAGSP